MLCSPTLAWTLIYMKPYRTKTFSLTLLIKKKKLLKTNEQWTMHGNVGTNVRLPHFPLVTGPPLFLHKRNIGFVSKLDLFYNEDSTPFPLLPSSVNSRQARTRLNSNFHTFGLNSTGHKNSHATARRERKETKTSIISQLSRRMILVKSYIVHPSGRKRYNYQKFSLI